MTNFTYLLQLLFLSLPTALHPFGIELFEFLDETFPEFALGHRNLGNFTGREHLAQLLHQVFFHIEFALAQLKVFFDVVLYFRIAQALDLGAGLELFLQLVALVLVVVENGPKRFRFLWGQFQYFRKDGDAVRFNAARTFGGLLPALGKQAGSAKACQQNNEGDTFHGVHDMW